jgi:PAS domain-containing protein
VSAPAKLQVNWEAHLEALPLPTWITQTRESPGGALECGPVFLNRACRDALGITRELAEEGLWTRYVHPEDRQACLVAWTDFLEGRTTRFHQTLRWIRPDTKDLDPAKRETVSLAVRAQKLLCGDIQGWLRSTAAEAALSRLEELTHVRR